MMQCIAVSLQDANGLTWGDAAWVLGSAVALILLCRIAGFFFPGLYRRPWSQQ